MRVPSCLLVSYMPLARTRSNNFLLVAGPVTRELRRVTLDLSSCEQPSKSLRALRLTEISTTSLNALSAEPANNTIEQFDDRTPPQDSRSDL